MVRYFGNVPCTTFEIVHHFSYTALIEVIILETVFLYHLFYWLHTEFRISW